MNSTGFPQKHPRRLARKLLLETTSPVRVSKGGECREEPKTVPLPAAWKRSVIRLERQVRRLRHERDHSTLLLELAAELAPFSDGLRHRDLTLVLTACGLSLRKDSLKGATGLRHRRMQDAAELHARRMHPEELIEWALEALTRYRIHSLGGYLRRSLLDPANSGGLDLGKLLDSTAKIDRLTCDEDVLAIVEDLVLKMTGAQPVTPPASSLTWAPCQVQAWHRQQEALRVDAALRRKVRAANERARWAM